jgi:hypothetical protein
LASKGKLSKSKRISTCKIRCPILNSKPWWASTNMIRHRLRGCLRDPRRLTIRLKMMYSNKSLMKIAPWFQISTMPLSLRLSNPFIRNKKTFLSSLRSKTKKSSKDCMRWKISTLIDTLISSSAFQTSRRLSIEKGLTLINLSKAIYLLDKSKRNL